MKNLLILTLLLGVLLTSCSATLKVRATAPVFDNAGTCPNPILTPASNQVWIHFAWTGPSSGQDSVSTTSGSLVNFSRNLPAGTYSVRAWASDLGGQGCDTTITVNLKNPPDKVRVLP